MKVFPVVVQKVLCFGLELPMQHDNQQIGKVPMKVFPVVVQKVLRYGLELPMQHDNQPIGKEDFLLEDFHRSAENWQLQDKLL